jgi:hypothetical protein
MKQFSHAALALASGRSVHFRSASKHPPRGQPEAQRRKETAPQNNLEKEFLNIGPPTHGSGADRAIPEPAFRPFLIPETQQTSATNRPKKSETIITKNICDLF